MAYCVAHCFCSIELHHVLLFMPTFLSKISSAVWNYTFCNANHWSLGCMTCVNVCLMLLDWLWFVYIKWFWLKWTLFLSEDGCCWGYRFLEITIFVLVFARVKRICVWVLIILFTSKKFLLFLRWGLSHCKDFCHPPAGFFYAWYHLSLASLAITVFFQTSKIWWQKGHLAVKIPTSCRCIINSIDIYILRKTLILAEKENKILWNKNNDFFLWCHE